MKPSPRHVALLVAGFVAFIGCSSKQDPAAELQKAAVALEKSDASTATSPAPGDGPASVSPSQQLKGAMEDYKAGKMEDAVTRLQLLRSATALSPEQRMALQDSIAAVMAEIYALAEKGDKRAIAAVAQYERMQTGR